jgi:hypothetical protein
MAQERDYRRHEVIWFGFWDVTTFWNQFGGEVESRVSADQADNGHVS